MKFWVDNRNLCEQILEAARGQGGGPVDPAHIAAIADELFAMEDRFVTNLEASPVPFEIERRQKGAKNYVVTRGLVFIHTRRKRDTAYIAPPHFVTDFASVPALLRGLVPQDGTHAAAAVIHDWLYTVADPPKKADAFRKERFRADRVFLDAMRASGVGGARRSLLYRGARLFGAGGFGAPSELRFIDPSRPDRLIDPAGFNKASLRAFTIIPRPQ